jgi:hypothetical protein
MDRYLTQDSKINIFLSMKKSSSFLLIALSNRVRDAFNYIKDYEIL